MVYGGGSYFTTMTNKNTRHYLETRCKLCFQKIQIFFLDHFDVLMLKIIF